jgi:hypothetical protein
MHYSASPNVAGNMPHAGIFAAVPISAQTAWCDAVISNLPRVAIPFGWALDVDFLNEIAPHLQKHA